MNDIKANTYTNHPAYQEPIIRSEFHNHLRYFFGVIVFVLISMPIVTSGIWAILYGSYELILSIYNMKVFNQLFLFKLLTPVLGYIGILIGIEFFYWARHLTRATSREFV